MSWRGGGWELGLLLLLLWGVHSKGGAWHNGRAGHWNLGGYRGGKFRELGKLYPAGRACRLGHTVQSELALLEQLLDLGHGKVGHGLALRRQHCVLAAHTHR